MKLLSTAILIFLLFVSSHVLAQGFVYPVGNPNERPTTDFPNSNGYDLFQEFMNEDDHSGVDLANGTEGGEVRAIGPGVVSLRRDTATSSGFGNAVLIRHDLPQGTFYSFYAHMQEDSVLVDEGDVVGTGDPIGRVDCTGNTRGRLNCPSNNGRGSHLHFAVKRTNTLGCGYLNDESCSTSETFDNYCDPLTFISTSGVCVGAGPEPATGVLALYDDFNSGTIDFQNRWTIRQEGGTAREIVAGKLHLAADVQGSTASNSGNTFDGSFLDFKNPDDVTAIRATVVVNEVTATDCAFNPSAGGARVAIHGTFFNVATPTPGSHVNDMRVEIRILKFSFDPGQTMSIDGFVHICTNVNCSATSNEQFASLGTITPGTPVTLQVTWDEAGNRFLFQRDSESPVSVTYTESDAASSGAKRKGVFVAGFPENCTSSPPTRGAIDVLIDDVFTNAGAVP